jgi:sRNA-binding protein
MSSEIKATAEMLHVIARLGKVMNSLPAVFPTPADPIVRPLEIGVGRLLHNRCVPPDDMTSAKAHSLLGDTLRRYVQSPRYRAALAAPGAWRHDLDGTPVEPVSEDHAEFARRQPSIPTKETITVLVSALKVSLPLRPEQLHPIDRGNA